MVYSKVKKYARKQVIRGAKFLNKRYPRNLKGVANLARDVHMLKQIINAEKKQFTLNFNNQIIGQINDNSSGGQIYDITPIPSQGTSGTTRVGNSLKLNGTYIRAQFNQQANLYQEQRIKFYLVETKGIPQATATAILHFFTTNDMIIGGSGQINDYFSRRNQDYFKNFIVHRTKTIKISRDQVSGASNRNVMVLKQRWKNQHVKFISGGGTSPSSGQLLLMVVADTGNIHPSNTSTISAGVTNKLPNSGSIMDLTTTSYYFDN